MLELVDRLINPARVVVVLLMAASLGHGIAGLLRSAAPPQAAVETPGTVASAATPAPATAAAIVSRHLFGNVAARAAPVVREIAETRLRLELHGVIVATDAELSAAVISEPNREGVLYTIGGRLPGNARLVAVNPDHVILARGGVEEKLSFPDNPARAGFDERGGAGAARTASTAAANAPASRGAAALERGRRRTAAESAATRPAPGRNGAGDTDPDAVAMQGPQAEAYAPASASEAFETGDDEDRGFGDSAADAARARARELVERISSDAVGMSELIEALGTTGVTDQDLEALGLAMDGGAVVLTESTPTELYARAGLRPGDQILTINGQPMEAVRNAPEGIEGLLDGGSARVEIQRGARKMTLTMKLP
jgi:general secretion pathway protein C